MRTSKLSTLTLITAVAAYIGATALPYTLTAGCVPPPEGLIAWWPFEEDSQDFWGINDGTLVVVSLLPMGPSAKH